MATKITWATEADVKEILGFIRELAVYEKLEKDVLATEESLRATLFGPRKYAEVIFLEEAGSKVAFALFFHNYSTFLAKPGIYLEDLYVKETHRGKGYGKKMLGQLAKIAVERGCGRLEWSVLNWNQSAIDFYHSLGAQSMSEWTVQRVTGPELLELSKRA